MQITTRADHRVVSDFNPADADYDTSVSGLAEARRECPVFWSTGYDGYWVVTTYDDITRVARDWETFSSQKVWEPETGRLEGGVTVPPFPARAFVPVEKDPPEWKRYRFLLNPFFAPKAAEAHRAAAEQMATALVDRVIEKGEFDLTLDFSNPLPALSTLNLLGIPFDSGNWQRWSEPFHKLAYARDEPDFDQTLADLQWIAEQFAEQVEACWASPKPGLFSQICNMDVKGGRFSKEELVDLGMMILVGGVGTTTALFSNTMVYLGGRPDVHRRLLDNLDMLPLAREEFVRYVTPVHGQARLVMRPVEIGGQKMEPGEQIFLPFSSANRDSKTFENPDEVVLDRMPNPHVGFGSGMHRCLGSFLARVFFDAMFMEVTRRMPDLTVRQEDAQRYHSVASVNGWIKVPAQFTPGKRVGTVLEL